MDHLRSAVSLVTGLSLFLASCNSPPHLQRVMSSAAGENGEGVSRVLLMPPDIELGEHGLTGSTARVDWAAEARQNVEAIVRDILGRRGKTVSTFLATDIQSSAAQDSAMVQQRAIVRELADRSFYPGSRRLVIGATRWSIGSAGDLRQESEPRYALFLGLRDRYSSTGRVVGRVALGVLFVAAIVMLGVPLVPPDLGDASPGGSPGICAGNGRGFRLPGAERLRLARRSRHRRHSVVEPRLGRLLRPARSG